MPSGEALIRQMVFGQRYFESRFGKRCEVAWLPDSFGLTGALPQLIRGTGEFFAALVSAMWLIIGFVCVGMKFFFTQKLSWWVPVYIYLVGLHCELSHSQE